MLQTAAIIWVNGEQAVCLPRAFWQGGDTVRVDQRGSCLVLLPPGPSPDLRWRELSPAERRAEIFALFGALPANDDAVPASDTNLSE